MSLAQCTKIVTKHEYDLYARIFISNKKQFHEKAAGGVCSDALLLSS